MKRPLFLVLPALAWMAACVHPQQIDLIEKEQRRMRGDLGALHSEMESVRSNLADTRANIQQVQRELSALREKLDEARYQMGRQIGQSSREGDQRVKELEARVGNLDQVLKAQADLLKARDDELKQLRESMLTAQTAATADPVMERSSEEGLAGETEAVKRDYAAARQALERKDYRAAIQRFKEFLKKHPKSKLASNAQYWIGESHYALREFDQAILEFDVVRRKYPQGDKVAAALLKQGFAFAELGEKVNARLLLQELVEKYPQSTEATRAKQRLKTLES